MQCSSKKSVTEASRQKAVQMDAHKEKYTTKAATSSPTVSLYAMMLTCRIDAKEGRHVTVTDIPCAFLQADMDQDVHVILEGKIAELIIKLEPSPYRKYIWIKALYRTLQAALLFWQLILKTLMEWGFKLNEYDPCVANKMINGKQCTIIWYVDDLKILKKGCGTNNYRFE